MCGCNNIVVNCGCCGKGNINGNSNGNDITPVGTVISYMGTKAPGNYLVCDGSVYNIADYKDFSQFIKDQFGSFNYFGGDGTATFAVPDLRGEFLRGTGKATRDTGFGGSVGKHQDGTILPLVIPFLSETTKRLYTRFSNNTSYNGFPKNTDKIINTVDGKLHESTQELTVTSSDVGYSETQFVSRPTNTAVLYCIKYE